MARCISQAPSWVPNRLFCGVATAFPNSLRVRRLRVPMLFLSSAQDDVVPPVMMRRLYDDCLTGAKRFVTFAASGHVDAWMARGYVQTWQAFAQNVLNGQVENDLVRIGHYAHDDDHQKTMDSELDAIQMV